MSLAVKGPVCPNIKEIVRQVTRRAAAKYLYDLGVKLRSKKEPIRPARIPLTQGSALMEPISPRLLYDFYSLLSNEGQLEFIDLLACVVSAEVPFRIVSKFDPVERGRFGDLVGDELMRQFFPWMLKEARRIARENPGLPDDKFEAEIFEAVTESTAYYNESISEIERARLKKGRERQSNPETIKRNVEICNLRKKDPETWSLKKLAKKYSVTVRAITKILKEEIKWRRLAAESGSGPTN